VPPERDPHASQELPLPSGRTIVVNSLISIAALAIALAALELAVRVFNLAPTDGTAKAAGGLKAILQFDTVLETRYAPHSATRIISPYGEFDVSYRINGLGLRGAELPKNGKPPDELRVLVAGNSFVEGWGVNEDDEFIRIAERAANAKTAGGKRVRLVNAGISAYGAAQSYLQAKAIWSDVEPDMVLLVLVGTMVNSDDRFLKQARLDDHGIAEGLSADAVLAGGTALAAEHSAVPPLLAALADHSAIARLVAQRLANRAAMDRIKVGDPASDMLAAYRAGPDLLERMYEPTLKHVAALAELARAHGKPFVLVHLPMAFQVSATSWDQGRKAYRMEERIYDSNEEALVKAFCRAHAMQCLFADEAIRAEAQRAGAPPLYFRYDFHFTPSGNRFLGNWLGRELARIAPTNSAQTAQPQQPTR
jgi:hypothetical protein